MAVKALNGIGGINQTPNLLGVLEISAEIGPIIPPGTGNLGHHPQRPEEPGCGGHLHCLYG